MTYEEAHAEFIRYHLDNRTGERRGRLERGHRHGESLNKFTGGFPSY